MAVSLDWAAHGLLAARSLWSPPRCRTVGKKEAPPQPKGSERSNLRAGVASVAYGRLVRAGGKYKPAVQR